MKIGITIGDPAGIGPEIILKALPKIKDHERILVYGNQKILKKTASALRLSRNYEIIKDHIIDCVGGVQFRYGKPTQKTGHTALASIDCGLHANLDIMITMPIVKEVIRSTNPDFIGHTEYLAQYFRIRNFAMIGLADTKRIMLLTTHLPLRHIFKKIKPDMIAEKIILLAQALRKYFGTRNPKIGVGALNPHAFEFSRGEDEQIEKGILLAKNKGVNVLGPYPTDSLFDRPFEGFLAMFHDQAMIYLKSKKRGLNFTMGLPIIRLSPLHGAALDIAGQRQANASGLITAVQEGIKMFKYALNYEKIV